MTSSIWLNDLAAYTLQAALLVGAGALLARLFRLRAGTATLAYWQVLLAACLLLPVCQPWKAPAIKATVTSSREVAGAADLSSLTNGSVHPTPLSKSWPVEKAALWIIAAGIMVRGSWLAAGFWSLRGLRRQSFALPGGMEPALDHARQRVRVRAEFRASGRTAMPITFGLRRPVILLPQNICELEPQTQQAIFYHELFHVRRRDWTWYVCEEFILMVLWFHPAIWWLIARIRLAREQVADLAVIELTESREKYVEALLAVARARMQTQLILAPLFLRKGLLKKRVAEILKETSMSRRRLFSCLAASALVLVLAAGVGARMFPLEARGPKPQQSSDPIQVVQGGENLTYRAALVYPGRAIERRVEGDVLLKISLDENGQVSDAAVLSGPEELRSSCLKSVLEWRFGPPAATLGTTLVLIRFQLPRDGATSQIELPEAPARQATYYSVTRTAGGWTEANGELTPAQRAEREMAELEKGLTDPKATAEDKAKMMKQLAERRTQLAQLREEQVATFRFMADKTMAGQIEAEIRDLRAGIADSRTTPDDRVRMQKQLAEREAQLKNRPGAAAGYVLYPRKVEPPLNLAASGEESRNFIIFYPRKVEPPINGKLVAIRTEGVPQTTQDVLFPRLGIQIGDTITEQIAQRVREAVLSFDAQLRALFHVDDQGNVTLVIAGR